MANASRGTDGSATGSDEEPPGGVRRRASLFLRGLITLRVAVLPVLYRHEPRTGFAEDGPSEPVWCGPGSDGVCQGFLGGGELGAEIRMTRNSARRVPRSPCKSTTACQGPERGTLRFSGDLSASTPRNRYS